MRPQCSTHIVPGIGRYSHHESMQANRCARTHAHMHNCASKHAHACVHSHTHARLTSQGHRGSREDQHLPHFRHVRMRVYTAHACKHLCTHLLAHSHVQTRLGPDVVCEEISVATERESLVSSPQQTLPHAQSAHVNMRTHERASIADTEATRRSLPILSSSSAFCFLF